MHTAIFRSSPVFLASVKHAQEARVALEAGADIIDCKDPDDGVLGALPDDLIADVVRGVGGVAPVSATIGDLPTDAETLKAAAVTKAKTGVDYVKVGFIDNLDPREAITALATADTGKARLVAVLMADREPDFSLIADFARANFFAVMLDTFDKRAALPDVLSANQLKEFLKSAKQHGLLSGLAGSLRIGHIADLVALEPAILGFRGALCRGGRRGPLDAARASEVERAIAAARRDRASGMAVA